MPERRPKHLRDAVVAAACALGLGCSSNVQDLGHSPPQQQAPVEPVLTEGLQGNPALIPPARSDLACPLSRPIEGDPCGLENSAACTFVGAPEHSPDRPAGAGEITTTFCICTAEQRWSCLQGVTMKTLVTPLHTGDACESGLTVVRSGVTCTCTNGEARCP